MSDRTCEKCGKKFKYPSALKVHLQRVTPCSPIVDQSDLTFQERQKPFSCKFCGRRYQLEQSMWRHMRQRCQIATSPQGMEKLYKHTLERQIEEQTRKNEELTNKLDKVMEMLSLHSPHLMEFAPPTSAARQPPPAAPAALHGAAHHTTNFIAKNAHIYHGPVAQINLFGREDLTHIDRPKIRQILDDVLSSTSDPSAGAVTAFLRAAMLIYSDPHHPENITCYLPNNKKDDVLVHGEAGWEVQPYTVVLPPMAMRSVDALFDNQPFEDCEKYGELMQALRTNEEAYKAGEKMKTVLVRNKALLERALGSLPR